MDAMEAIRTRRSIRKFTERPVEQEKVDKILEMARYYPCAANLQPLRFQVVQDPEHLERLRPLLKWAAYIPEYRQENTQSPNLLILIWGDKEVAKDFSFCAGAAATQMMIAANSLGISSCCLGIGATQKVYEATGVPQEKYAFQCVIALGYSEQTSLVVDQQDSCRYWIDDCGNFVVPKLRTDELLIHPDRELKVRG